MGEPAAADMEHVDGETSTARRAVPHTLDPLTAVLARAITHLNGVFFESDGSKCRMVSTDGHRLSTDGHRLSKVERTIPNGPKLSAGVIIPKKALLEIKKVLEQGPRAEGW